MATSGAMNTSNQYVKYTISIAQNSQNVNNNSSNVTVSVRFYRTNTGYTTYGSGTIYCKINGTTYSESVTSDQKITSSGIVLFTKTLSIPHNTDGTKVLTASAWININTPLTSSEQSYSQTMTTIARATTPTINVSSVAIGGEITISTLRASSSFTHTLRYSFANTSGIIASGVTTSSSWTVPTSLGNLIPNATSGILTISCDTYNGSTKIGTKSTTVTVTIPGTAVPTISNIAVTEAVGGLSSKFGAFVRNQSRLSVSVTASGVYSSSIVSIISKVCGKTYNGSSFTVETVNLCENVTIETTVTDSRGRTATLSKAITVLDYEVPAISKMKANRCNQDGTANDEGNYVKIEYAFNISPVNNKNDKSFIISYKKSGDASYTRLTTGSVYSANTSIVPNTVFSGDNAYNLMLTITDYFKTVTYEIEVATAFTLVDYHASGRGIAFGKVAEKSNAMEIALNIYDRFDKVINNGLAVYNNTAIDPNTSLDELILTDHGNAPSGGFYYIRTTFYSTKNTTANRSQVAIPYNNAGGIWYRYFYNGSWSAWTQPINDSKWINLTLESGWTYQYDADRPQYRKVGNIVYLRGLVNGTSGAGTTISTLPTGYRPYGSFNRFDCALNQNERANVQVNGSGVISDYAKGSTARTFLSLSGISFPI